MYDYIFMIRTPILSVEFWFLSLLLGLCVGYFANRSKKTLYRIPYLFLFAVVIFIYMVLSWLVTHLFLTTAMFFMSPLPLTVLLCVPSFLLGASYMALSVMRARDGFGSKRPAWMIIIPILNVGLFIVTLDDDKNDPEPPITRDPIPTAKFMNGGIGVVLGTFIAMSAFFIGMQMTALPEIGGKALPVYQGLTPIFR